MFALLGIGIASVSCIFLVIYTIEHRRRGNNVYGLPYPPGPTPNFLAGKFSVIPKERSHIEYAKWSQQYNSDVVSLNVLGFRTVIVNSASAAKELLEKRSAIYSSRPVMEIANMMGFDFSIAFMPYSDRWRIHRRMLHQMFRPHLLHSYDSMQLSEVGRLLKTIMRNPNEVANQVKYYAGSLAMKTAYGSKGDDSASDRYIHISEEAVEMMTQMMFPGTVLLSVFPALKHLPKWIPGIHKFKSFAEKCKVLTDELQNSLFDSVKQDMKNGIAPPSLAAEYLRKMGTDGEAANWDENALKSVMANVHLGGADTSMSAMQGAILALLLHPAVQERAHEEIDRVVGRDRLPDFSDRPRLPYVEAICREVLRLHPILPMAVPHTAIKDDVYEGYFIPKGTLVMGNCWAILHDPEVYPHPEEFRPERFINSDGTLSEDDVAAVFGFGRRICPGRHFAMGALFLVVASILSVFDIVKAKDAEGREVDVNGEYDDADITHPLPFSCSVWPRDDKAKVLITSLRA